MSPRRNFASPASSSAMWPDAHCEDPAADKVRLFVLALQRAMEGSGGAAPTIRGLAREVGMDHSLLSDLLAGRSWPSSMTIAQLEIALDASLWPEHKSR